ncbi:DnaJ-domain-containing protein [Auriscalpium vulgare]|uniref:DnaJ-domain-containing protein n=1 Tax=Auriscalpium vulgare TaxID=40419 RepID=A0ACB8SA09_9AGAM|nr:DnaJ-domain-containing protein [Auriscalpium vulgare]
MAGYKYDESGSMALFFVLTVLVIVLVPVTLSFIFSSSSKESRTASCQCGECAEKRTRLRKARGAVSISRKGLLLAAGWALVGIIAYKVSGVVVETQIYDPFEILGLKSGVTEKEIKSHFKKLSKIYHPDKVKLTANDTAESVAAKFVDITKAYKSLTDETIRKNFEDYGHPDGRQEISMGIALPRWIVEAQNNIWVLGIYALIFGVSLPALVGNWWFGNMRKTKDGVFAQTAASFFKSITENSDLEEVVGALGKATEWEQVAHKVTEKELGRLEESIEVKLGEQWRHLRVLVKGATGARDSKWNALVLLYAHLLRLPLTDASLKKAQSNVLLQTPHLLNALLTISMARNWYHPTVAVMRLHAYLFQAIVPGDAVSKFRQLPGIEEADVKALPEDVTDIEDFVHHLEKKGDGRVADIKKAADRWGRLELVDVGFKVIGERIITPSAIVFLVVKLRLSPPSLEPQMNGKALESEVTVGDAIANAKKDEEFLNSGNDAEDLQSPSSSLGVGHAPHWPVNRKAGWWMVLADVKSNRIVVPPVKITDVPFSHAERSRNYRSYKLKFQSPPNVGLFTWRLFLVSDTYVGEEVVQDIALHNEDVSKLSVEEQGAEDEISDPEEDSLAGQMAAMQGRPVKKRRDESDEESSSEEESEAANDSSSDSD